MRLSSVSTLARPMKSPYHSRLQVDEAQITPLTPVDHLYASLLHRLLVWCVFIAKALRYVKYNHGPRSMANLPSLNTTTELLGISHITTQTGSEKVSVSSLQDLQ